MRSIQRGIYNDTTLISQLEMVLDLSDSKTHIENLSNQNWSRFQNSEEKKIVWLLKRNG